MNFTADILPTGWLLTGNIIFALSLVLALLKAPWFRLRNAADANILFAACIILWLFWRASAGVTPGMEYHLLMATTATLMFGWAFALMAVSVAQLILTLEGQTSWLGFGLNVLCNGILPIVITHYLYRLVYQTLPKNFFIYIFVVAFAGSALTMLFSRLAGLTILLGSGAYTMQELGDDPLFMIVMLFPEGFLNGMLMTILVVYRPEWVSSFDDRVYLHNK